MRTASLLVLLIALFAAPVLAQESTPEPGIDLPACSAEQLAEIDAMILEEAEALDTALHVPEGKSSLDLADDVTIVQRRYWTWVILWRDDCAELYTRAYEFGRIVDEYSIAIGMGMASLYALEQGDSDAADRFADQLEKHLREAQRVIRTKLPELDMLVDERYQ